MLQYHLWLLIRVISNIQASLYVDCKRKVPCRTSPSIATSYQSGDVGRDRRVAAFYLTSSFQSLAPGNLLENNSRPDVMISNQMRIVRANTTVPGILIYFCRIPTNIQLR